MTFEPTAAFGGIRKSSSFEQTEHKMIHNGKNETSRVDGHASSILMTLIHPLGFLEVQPFFDRIGVEKQQFNGALGGELVLIDCPDIVSPSLYNLFGELAWGMQSISDDNFSV